MFGQMCDEYTKKNANKFFLNKQYGGKIDHLRQDVQLNQVVFLQFVTVGKIEFNVSVLKVH